MTWFLISSVIFFILACLYYYRTTVKNKKNISDNDSSESKQNDESGVKPVVKKIEKSSNYRSLGTQILTVVFLVALCVGFLCGISYLKNHNFTNRNTSEPTLCTIPTVRYYTFKKGENKVDTVKIGQHNFNWTVQGGSLIWVNGSKTATGKMSNRNESLSGDLRKLYVKADSFYPGSDEISLKIVIENVEYIE